MSVLMHDPPPSHAHRQVPPNSTAGWSRASDGSVRHATSSPLSHPSASSSVSEGTPVGAGEGASVGADGDVVGECEGVNVGSDGDTDGDTLELTGVQGEQMSPG